MKHLSHRKFCSSDQLCTMVFIILQFIDIGVPRRENLTNYQYVNPSFACLFVQSTIAWQSWGFPDHKQNCFRFRERHHESPSIRETWDWIRLWFHRSILLLYFKSFYSNKLYALVELLKKTERFKYLFPWYIINPSVEHRAKCSNSSMMQAAAFL